MKKFNYFLVTFNVCYQKEGKSYQRILNGLMHQEERNFNSTSIASATQRAVQRFSSEHKSVDIQNDIYDVIILNIVHLGSMTPEEFQGDYPQAEEDLKDTLKIKESVNED